MKKEDIKTLEDAMTYISEIEKKFENRETEIEALESKIKTLEDSNTKLSEENTSVKEKYFDLWLKEGRQTKSEETKVEEPVNKTLDELLMED